MEQQDMMDYYTIKFVRDATRFDERCAVCREKKFPLVVISGDFGVSVCFDCWNEISARVNNGELIRREVVIVCERLQRGINEMREYYESKNSELHELLNKLGAFDKTMNLLRR